MKKRLLQMMIIALVIVPFSFVFAGCDLTGGECDDCDHSKCNDGWHKDGECPLCDNCEDEGGVGISITPEQVFAMLNSKTANYSLEMKGYENSIHNPLQFAEYKTFGGLTYANSKFFAWEIF